MERFYFNSQPMKNTKYFITLNRIANNNMTQDQKNGLEIKKR